MNQRMVSASDYKEVAKVAAQYIEAIRTGNIGLLDNMFHKNAVAYGTVDGALVGVPVILPLNLLKPMANPPKLNIILTCLT